MSKEYKVCCEILDDNSHYLEVSKHSSAVAAERAARKYEAKTGLTTWVDSPDDGEE